MIFWLVASFLWYQAIAHFGISLGLHRYFAHRQFRMPLIFEYVALFMAMIAGARSPIGWIAAHRMHHSYSDSELDPHSPRYKGFLTVLFSQWKIDSIPPKFSRDLFKSRSLRFFHNNWKWMWPGVGLVSFLISPSFFLFFFFVPAVVSWISFGLLNSVCHIKGEAQNVPIINWLTGGEGYHLEHHLDGRRYRFHKNDLTGYCIEFLLSKKVFKR